MRLNCTTVKSASLLLALWLLVAPLNGISQRAAAGSTAGVPGSRPTERTSPPQTTKLVFEVATFKPAAISTDGHTHINYPSGGRFSATNITLLALMEWAFDVPAKQILDGPAWLASTRFDIEASADQETDARLRSIPSAEANRLKRQMVQTLLADRCELRSHGETRLLAAYDLVVVRSGAKLQPSQGNGKSISIGRTLFRAEGLSLPLVAQELSRVVGRPVVDRTKLADRYDLNLHWAPDDEPAPPDNSAPSLLTALQEQLGLKLEATKEPVPVLAIDHIGMPSAN